ncbi:Flagellar hook-length control protein FliK [Planococcus massiliensis]|uniref:Flagellar hook-length control protein FliK n=1 Tax=Planococcus massiliensis TaxID=1499687 RepID=A0A098EPW3_9BACL|nr:flagellar hook-length control protein FliK [Planococcus massiliensis]CEG24333.1 Flagellar hook-length control protein FliK [Planococcus massiliensis]
MNPIDALKVSFQPPVNQTAKASKTKTEGMAAELGAFSQLLASASAETTETGAEPTTEIQAQLEEILKALQDLPAEDLSPEQQEMLAAIMQLLSLQVTQLETNLDEQNLIQAKPTSPEVVSAAPAGAQQTTSVLLQEIQQKLQQLMNNDITEFDMPREFMGVEAENLSADPEQLEQAMKQLTQMVQELEDAEAVTGKATASQQSEKIEQVMKQLSQLNLDVEARGLPAEAAKPPLAEAGRMAQTPSVFQALEIENFSVESAPQTEAPAAPIESAKAQAVQPAPRAETPVVRMANLVEDLSGLLRGSMRLSGTGENAQIKVSIFPEHLGHLDIRLTTVDGKVAAQIFTSSLVAKEAIEMQLNQLRHTMLQQGVNLDRIEITQQSSEQSFGQQTANPEQRFNQQQKQGAPNGKNGYQRIEEEVAAAASRSFTPDGSMMKVDYTI